MLGQPRVGRLELPRLRRSRRRLRRCARHRPLAPLGDGAADRARPRRAREAERQPTNRQRCTRASRPDTRTAAPAPAAITPLAADEDDIASWAATLEDNSRLTRRLALERAWGIRVIRQLQIGFDGARITIPVRDAHGALQGVCRYDPFGPREPKMLALPGTRLGLIPIPRAIAQKYVVLVEGPPDMIAARSCGLAAIAVPGTSAWQPPWADSYRQARDARHGLRPAGRAAAERSPPACARPYPGRIVDLAPGRNDGYDLTDRILERRRQAAPAQRRDRRRAVAPPDRHPPDTRHAARHPRR